MSGISIRTAVKDDLMAIVELMRDDPLGMTRESGEGSFPAYEAAFADIDADPNNLVLVAEEGGVIVGCMQVTFIANLSFEGGRRALVEGVRVSDSHQGRGLGRMMMEHVVEMARDRKCRMVQLTSNKERPGAIRFYEKLGFVPSHVGFKLYL